MALSLWWRWSSRLGLCWVGCLVFLASWPYFSEHDSFNLLYFPETQPSASQGITQTKRLQQRMVMLKWICFSSYSNYSHTCLWHEFEVLYPDKDFSVSLVTPTVGTKHSASPFLCNDRASLGCNQLPVAFVMMQSARREARMKNAGRSSWSQLCEGACFGTYLRHSRAPTCLYGSTRMSLPLSHFGLEGNAAINH